MLDKLTALFCPQSIVVIGASRSPEKIGAVVLQNILDSKFPGKVYAVNPNAEKIGEIKCFESVIALPEIPDLAVIAIPKFIVLDVMERAGKKGIKNFVILTAGFKETGSEGANLEKQLAEITKKYEMNILGPNCLGFVNKNCPINATFAHVSDQSGNLRFISQSGAIAASLFDWCDSENLGFSEFVTLGNKTDINEVDVLNYFFNKNQNEINTLVVEGAAKVDPIGMYLESISNGEKFIEIAEKITKKNPLFIIKPGKSEAAALAMQSHTGAIAGSNDVLETALKDAGVLRCNTLEDFFDVAKAFSWEDIPQGPKVAVVSNAGGPAVISADAIIKEELEVAKFNDQTKQKLAEALPRAATILNPVDVMGDALPNRYAKAIEIVLKSGQCDALVVILTPQIVTQVKETAEIIGQMSKKYQKPIFCSFIGGRLVSEGIQKLNEYKIPSFNYPERAISAIGAMWKFSKQRQKITQQIQDINVLNKLILPEKATKTLKDAIEKNQKALDNLEASEIVSSTGINVPPTTRPETLQEGKEFAEKAGYPVVLKLSSPGLIHKKDVGGVILGIKNPKDLEKAWDTLERKVEYLDSTIKENVHFQIQKEVVFGVEVIVGVKRDPTFGPVLLFGAGGSLAEMIADKNLHLLPVDINAAKELVQNSKIYKLLKGSESDPSYALDKLYDLIILLSKLMGETPEIAEIEINPVIVSFNNVYAVDTKVFLETKKPQVPRPKFKTATILSAKHLAGKTRYFELDLNTPYKFDPGQYISVKVSSNRINCYSIADQKDDEHFNLLVDSTPGGLGSKFFDALKPRDKITYIGPFGTLKLEPDDGAENLLFLATGCGIAPFKYMIKTLLEDEDLNKNISLYFGIDKYENIILEKYFSELTQKHPNFKFKISVEKPNKKWKGHTGFINELVKNDYPDASNCSAYLCGSKFMIKDTKNILLDNGCAPARIYTEQF